MKNPKSGLYIFKWATKKIVQKGIFHDPHIMQSSKFRVYRLSFTAARSHSCFHVACGYVHIESSWLVVTQSVPQSLNIFCPSQKSVDVLKTYTVNIAYEEFSGKEKKRSWDPGNIKVCAHALSFQFTAAGASAPEQQEGEVSVQMSHPSNDTASTNTATS